MLDHGVVAARLPGDNAPAGLFQNQPGQFRAFDAQASNASSIAVASSPSANAAAGACDQYNLALNIRHDWLSS
ncbi:hypothetical protein ALQ96_03594 [Pseudomonas syringae pv. atrofaciens]|nr:hypothetical protein ALQ96_03594 [Pseudomonas syringae pv. atrofaciens]